MGPGHICLCIIGLHENTPYTVSLKKTKLICWKIKFGLTDSLRESSFFLVSQTEYPGLGLNSLMPIFPLVLGGGFGKLQFSCSVVSESLQPLWKTCPGPNIDVIRIHCVEPQHQPAFLPLPHQMHLTASRCLNQREGTERTNI